MADYFWKEKIKVHRKKVAEKKGEEPPVRLRYFNCWKPGPEAEVSTNRLALLQNCLLLSGFNDPHFLCTRYPRLIAQSPQVGCQDFSFRFKIG